MAWTNSKIFRQYLADILGNVTAMDLDADTIKAALYDNDITPDVDATAANTAYNAGQWVITGNEVIDTTGGGTDWPAGGVALAGKTVSTATSAVVMFDATTDTASGATADIANAYGCLVYDDTIATPVAKQGVCYNYFGGTNSVTNGTFTIVWSANGIFRFTL